MHRSELGTVIGELVTKFAVPIRVEIHEQDGSVYADIIQPPPPEESAAEDQADEESGSDRPGVPELIEVRAGGYVPGEEVAVAVILRHSSADGHGNTRALLDRAELPDPDSAEVVLLGRISQTATVRALT